MHEHIDRRRFLQEAGSGAAAMGLGIAMAQASAQEAPKVVERADPNAPKTGRLLQEGEVIGLGIIGLGLIGGYHVDQVLKYEKGGERVQLRALCDLYTRRRNQKLAHAQADTGRQISAYGNYKELLSRDDIHAVVIATPDHRHAQISLDALDAGKDVYCEKPMTHTIEEALRVRNRVFETGRIYQCGAQGTSEEMTLRVREYIRQGALGKMVLVQADFSRNSAGGPDNRGGEWNNPFDEDATDDPNGGEGYINWLEWLGTAPARPFSKPRFFQFRKFWDYSGGIATDLLYHELAKIMVALDAPAPEKVVASGGIFVQHDDREAPDTLSMCLDYPDDYTVVLTSSVASAQGPVLGVRGHFASMQPDVGGIILEPENEFREWFRQKYGADFIKLEPQEIENDHMLNWLQCVRSRQKPNFGAEAACNVLVAIAMGVDAYRTEKTVYWDARKECCVSQHPRPDRKSKLPAEIS